MPASAPAPSASDLLLADVPFSLSTFAMLLFSVLVAAVLMFLLFNRDRAAQHQLISPVGRPSANGVGPGVQADYGFYSPQAY